MIGKQLAHDDVVAKLGRRGRALPFGAALPGVRAAMVLASLAVLSASMPLRAAEAAPAEPRFPVQAELFLEVFAASEGLTFNGEGDLFVGAEAAVWRVTPDGEVERIADVYSHLGQAGIGARDILAADFGPAVALRGGPNTDGIIWRITPEGERSVAARGIPDPNFVLVREDGSYLVSDDFADTIYLVDTEGTVRLWSDAIQHPNGLALSPDGRTLYAAQIFTGIAPLGFSDRLWALPVGEDGEPAGAPELVAETGRGGLDGLAMDERGRVYIADNGGGAIWRYDPESEELVLIAEGMPNAASMVFGEGDFDPYSLYVTTTFRGGGRLWRVPVGARGVKQHRPEISTSPPARPPSFAAAASISLTHSGAFGEQAAFTDALEELYAFRYEAAREAFRAIQARDGEFALAYWGEAMTHYRQLTGEADLAAARDAMRRLEQRAGAKLAASGRDSERALIEASALLFADRPPAAREEAYAARLGEAVERLPTEVELVTWHAVSLSRRGAREGDSELDLRAAAILESVLDERPRHPGALHALIHLYERMGATPLEQRVRARYAEIRPGMDHQACR